MVLDQSSWAVGVVDICDMPKVGAEKQVPVLQ